MRESSFPNDSRGRETNMCILCNQGKLQMHYRSRRNFLKGAAASGIAAAAGLNLFAARPAAAQVGDPPAGTGSPGRRYVIRGGSVMSMDPLVDDVSQIHHSPQHSDAAIQALFDTGRRAAFGYFESAGGVAGNQYPQDAVRIKNQYFSSTDQLVTMIMGGEVYLGPQIYQQSWTIGRQLGLQIAAHILSPFGITPILDQLAQNQGGVGPGGTPPGTLGIGSDNLFIHMTGQSD